MKAYFEEENNVGALNGQGASRNDGFPAVMFRRLPKSSLLAFALQHFNTSTSHRFSFNLSNALQSGFRVVSCSAVLNCLALQPDPRPCRNADAPGGLAKYPRA
jgi:hypothetical protein